MLPSIHEITQLIVNRNVDSLLLLPENRTYGGFTKTQFLTFLNQKNKEIGYDVSNKLCAIEVEGTFQKLHAYGIENSDSKEKQDFYDSVYLPNFILSIPETKDIELKTIAFYLDTSLKKNENVPFFALSFFFKQEELIDLWFCQHITHTTIPFSNESPADDFLQSLKDDPYQCFPGYKDDYFCDDYVGFIKSDRYKQLEDFASNLNNIARNLLDEASLNFAELFHAMRKSIPEVENITRLEKDVKETCHLFLMSENKLQLRTRCIEELLYLTDVDLIDYQDTTYTYEEDKLIAQWLVGNEVNYNAIVGKGAMLNNLLSLDCKNAPAQLKCVWQLVESLQEFHELYNFHEIFLNMKYDIEYDGENNHSDEYKRLGLIE